MFVLHKIFKNLLDGGIVKILKNNNSMFYHLKSKLKLLISAHNDVMRKSCVQGLSKYQYKHALLTLIRVKGSWFKCKPAKTFID